MKWYVVTGNKAAFNKPVVPVLTNKRPNEATHDFYAFANFTGAKEFAIDYALDNMKLFKRQIRTLRSQTAKDFIT